jgi:hypothetical protein
MDEFVDFGQGIQSPAMGVGKELEMKRQSTHSILKIVILIITFSYSSAASAQSVDGTLGNLSGKKFILLGHKDEKVLTISETDLKKRREECAVAVSVLAASYSVNRWQFDLRAIGTIDLDKASGLTSPKPCRKSQYNPTLVITGDGSNDRESVLTSILNSVLVTPDIYLSRLGKMTDVREIDETETAIAVKATDKIRAAFLLGVEPYYTEKAREAHLQGAAVASIVVGTNGRIQSPKILTSFESGMDEQFISVLSLWRLVPAHDGGKAVPVITQIVMNFHLS